MRRIDDLQAFVKAVEDKKRALGITPDVIEQARNGGRRRDTEKRAFLAAIQERAKASGLQPLPANF